jgi:glycogen(starch) synthase
VRRGSFSFPTSTRSLIHSPIACRGAQQTWESLIRGKDDEEEESGYPFPLVLKRKNTAGSVSGTTSGSHTPGGTVPNGRGKSLSEHDLAQADQALSNHSAA